MLASGNLALQRLFFLFFSVLLMMLPNYILSATTSDLSQLENPFGSIDQFNKHLAQIGITYTLTNDNVEIIVDQTKALNSLPLLISRGLVSRLDSEYVNVAPFSVSVVLVGVSSTINILNSIFERNEPDKLHVDAYLIPIGAKIKKLCYTFDYDREKFEILDLGILTPRVFVKSTPQFAFSDWCKTNLDNEAAKLNIH